jgi:pSer/pThr/pTyr-binding forkhead associated (FHA) protein
MAGKSPASHHSISSGKTAPTLTPTGKFAGKPEVPLSRTVTLVGSGAGARLQLISSSVSKSHSLLVNCDRGVYVRDLASRTKVIVNGKDIREAVLKQGDAVQFGKFAFTFNEPPGRDDETRDQVEPPVPGQIEVTGVDSPIPLNERCLLLGRRDTCDIVVSDDSVSTAHAVIFEMDGRRFVRDLGSRTGTFVNGNQVHQAELEIGDTIRIGQIDLKYQTGEQDMSADLFESGDLNDLVQSQDAGLEDAVAAAMAAKDVDAPAEEEIAVEEVAVDEIAAEEPAVEEVAVDDIEAVEVPADEEQLAEDALADFAPMEVDAVADETDAAPVEELAPVPEEPAVEPLPVEEELVVDEAPPPPVAAPVAPPRSPFADGDRRSKPAERAMPFMAMAGPLEFAAPINLRNVPVPEEREPVAPPPPEPVEKVAPVQEIEPEEIAVEEEVSTAGGELELASEELIEAMPTEQLVGDDLMDDRVARDVPTELPVEEIAVDSERLAQSVSEVEEPVEEEISAEEEAVADDDAIAVDEEAEREASQATDAEELADASAEETEPQPLMEDEAEEAASEEGSVEEPEAPVFDAAEETEEALPQIDTLAMEAEANEPEEELSFELPEVEEQEPAPLADIPAMEELSMDEAAGGLTFAPTPEEAALDLGSAAQEAALGVPAVPADEMGQELKLDLGTDTEDVSFGGDAVDADALKLDLGPEYVAPVAAPRIAAAVPVELATPEIPVKPIAKAPAKSPAKPKRQAPARAKKTPPAPVVKAPPAPEPEPEPIAEAPPLPVEQKGLDKRASSVEVIEEAASPQSVMEVDDELSRVDIAPESVSPIEQVSDLTDTRFGRAVEEFTEDATTGPLVEETATAAQDEVAEVQPAQDDAGQAIERDVEEEFGIAEVVETSAADDFDIIPALDAPLPLDEAPSSPDDSMAGLLAAEEKTEEEIAADPMAGFSSFNTLARSLDLPEPVESLPGLDDGAEDKFGTLEEPELSPLDHVRDDEVGAESVSATEEIPTPRRASDEPFEEVLVDELLGSSAPAEVDHEASLTKAMEEALAEPVAEAPINNVPPSPTRVPESESRVVEMPRPRAPVDPNWGANQEHFLGGMPLRLGDVGTQPAPAPLVARPVPAAPRPKPAAQPGIPAEPARPAAAAKMAPPLPQQRQRPTPKPRSPHAGGMGLVSAPPEQAPAKQVTTGFDGLAMGSTRQVDVFSQMSPPLSGDPFAGSGSTDVFGRKGPGAAPPAQGPPRAPRQAPRRAEQTPGSGSQNWNAASPPPPEIPSDDSTEAGSAPPPPELEAPKKKRRWFGLKSLLIFMLLSMAGTAGAIWYVVPDRTLATGRLKFNNFAKLTEGERRALDRKQQELLASEQVRKEARAVLTLGKHVDPGFLDKPAEFGKAVAGAKLDFDSGVLSVSYAGSDLQNDKPRMRALMQALYSGNEALIREAGSLRSEVVSLQREQQRKLKELEDIKGQLEQLRHAAESRPDPSEMTRLESAATRVEGEYHDAVAAVAKMSADIDKLKGQATTSPAGIPVTNAPIVDAQLSQDETDLAKLTERIATVKDMRNKKAAQARLTLDAAMASFQKQIEQAQAAVKGNPDLAKYFSSAQAMQDSTKELTEQFLRRQQEQYSRLNELKVRMDEKLAARRDDAMKNDPKLKEYLDQKAIKSRQYSAAVGSNLTKDAEEIKADLSLLEQMIKARQTQIGDDQFYVDAIEQLQKIIVTTEKGIVDDRKDTEKVLEQMRLAFAKNQPAKEKLPANEKAAASELEKQLASVEEARKQYAEAAEHANAQADEEIRQMEANAVVLTTKISGRKRQLQADRDKNYEILTSRERQATLTQKQQELARAQAVLATAEAAQKAARTQLTDAATRLTDAQEAGSKRDALMKIHDRTSKEFDQIRDQLEMKQHLVDARPEPKPIAENDVEVVDQGSMRYRWIYTLSSAGVVAALFACFIVMSGGSRSSMIPPPPFAEPGAYGLEAEAYGADRVGYETMEDDSIEEISADDYLPDEGHPSEESDAAVA